MAQETGLFDARIADRLYRSCEEGDVEQLRRLLETKSPNTLQVFRDTIREHSALQPSPLVAAASSGHYRVVQMLMESDLVTGLPVSVLLSLMSTQPVPPDLLCVRVWRSANWTSQPCRQSLRRCCSGSRSCHLLRRTRPAIACSCGTWSRLWPTTTPCPTSLPRPI